MGALAELRPPQADATFAYAYARGEALSRSNLRILDAGCGTGFSTLKLAEANPQAEIVALDLSQSSLDIAQERLKAAGLWSARIHFEQQDLQALSQNGQERYGRFDYIHSSGVLHHLPQPELGLQALRRMLKTQGLAFFMVYSGRARREIEAIQELVYGLWQNQEDWSEGLFILRSLMQSLSSEHALRRHYDKALQTAQDVLGQRAAQSDAFLVDTYLQRCEWRWTQPEWFRLLEDNGWHAGRWLDEAAWRLSQYIPALQHQVQALTPAQSLALCDYLRPPHNFAHFLSAETLPRLEQPLFDWEQIPAAFYCVQRRETNYASTPYALHHGLGLQLALEASLSQAWDELDGQRSWEQIWERAHQAHPGLSRSAFQHFAKQLLEHCFVGLAR